VFKAATSRRIWWLLTTSRCCVFLPRAMSMVLRCQPQTKLIATVKQVRAKMGAWPLKNILPKSTRYPTSTSEICTITVNQTLPKHPAPKSRIPLQSEMWTHIRTFKIHLHRWTKNRFKFRLLATTSPPRISSLHSKLTPSLLCFARRPSNSLTMISMVVKSPSRD